MTKKAVTPKGKSKAVNKTKAKTTKNPKSNAGRPLKFKTAAAMQKVIDEYFESVTYFNDTGAKFLRPTVSGLAYALDMSTESLRKYGNKDQFVATVKRAKQKVEIALEQGLYNGQVTGLIFNLKNNFNWRDKQEVEQSGGITVVELQTSFKKSTDK